MLSSLHPSETTYQRTDVKLQTTRPPLGGGHCLLTSHSFPEAPADNLR